MTRWEIGVQIDEQFEGKVDENWARRVVEKTLEAESVPERTEVGLVVTDDEEVRKLNRTYRGFDEPTDVLSFALTDEAESEAGGGPFHFVLPPDLSQLGDVIISYDSAERQARERGIAVERELALLIVHGVLHLLGYNHAEEVDEKIMRVKEQAVIIQI